MPLSVCVVEGNNYFKLRDLGKAHGFHVSWNDTTRSVVIDSKSPHAGG